MKNKFLFLYIILLLSTLSLGQDIKIGSQDNRFSQAGGFYDYSDARFVNVSVQIWGYVKFAGKYYVPENTRLVDLISYAGGPLSDANLDDIQIYRNTDGTEIIKNINIKGMYEVGEEVNPIAFQKIKAGDVIIFPGQPKLYLRDNIQLITSVASTIVTVATFIFISLRK